jgi:hypothetical protein
MGDRNKTESDAPRLYHGWGDMRAINSPLTIFVLTPVAAMVLMAARPPREITDFVGVFYGAGAC